MVFFGHALVSPEHCIRGVHCLNKHCIVVYRPISTKFSACFSEGIALSDALHSSDFCR